MRILMCDVKSYFKINEYLPVLDLKCIDVALLSTIESEELQNLLAAVHDFEIISHCLQKR